MEDYADAIETNKKPRQFEVIDKIYQNEFDEIESKLKEESPSKLKRLNNVIDERILKGTEILNNKRADAAEEDADKLQLQKAKERIQAVLDRIEAISKKQRAEQENRSIIQVTNKVLSLDPKQS